MYAVGRLGSYISSPFHPFGGAVDIIVVEQPDGSLKSSPWYVRFGKFQGVLKVKEKVVKINVNGVEADYHMYLDHKGEAFFLREVDDDEELDSVFYPSSSGEDTDSDRRPMKSKSCNFDAAALSGSLPPLDGKVLTRTNSRRSRIMGLVFGRRSMEESSSTQKEEDGGADSSQRAEVAADLLEVNWSTDRQKGEDSISNVSGDEAGMNVSTDQSNVDLKTINCMEYTVMNEESGYSSETRTTSSRFHVHKLESSGSDVGVEMLCLNTKHVDGTSDVGGSCLQEDSDCLAESEAAELALVNAGCEETTKVLLSEMIISDAQSADCPGNKLDQEQEEQEFQDKVTLGNGICNEVSGSDTVEETSFDSSCGSATDVCMHPKTLNETAELISEMPSIEETSLLVTKEELDTSTVAGKGNCAGEEASSSLFGDTIVTQSYVERVAVSPVIGSVQEVEPCSISSTSSFQNSISEQEVEPTIDEDHSSMIHGSSETLSDCQDSGNDSSPRKLITVSTSEVSDKEQLLFGDLDDLSDGDSKSSCLRSETKEHCSSITSEDNEAVYHNVASSPRTLVAENPQNEIEGSEKHSRIISGYINVPRSRNIAGGDDVGRMVESLPNIWYPSHDFVSDDFHSLPHSLDTNSPSAKWNPPAEDFSNFTELDPDKEVKIEQSTLEDAEVGEQLRQLPANLAAGDGSVINASSGNWRVWPFSFRRSRSIKKSLPARSSTKSSNDDSTAGSFTGKNGNKDVTKPQVKKTKLRALTPTPQQLASLNLDEGKNIITFTFSTSMLGQQQVDARIYLWKWDSRVVISDVDGTITKSDVLGQFMPMVGVDWSHTGVTHLFSAIKENGYKLLFLSARSISQAYLTRQFLLNLKQDGKALPDGPVVISPDGLFPSLFREVIRRAPHEFKIACLEDIKAIFPPDRNPFYAGFGNRDTDELSYLKVGIPIGKIFIINPKGEVVVNRTVDSKSYTSLHDLVHDIFPPTCSSEQEDFNDLNFWKLPPSTIDV